MITKSTTIDQIKRAWHLIDAKGEVLGRLSTRIASVLTGKNKSYFVRNLDCGDYVVIVNARQVQFTGNKLSQKIYTRYSGYPGGLKKTKLIDMMTEKPTEVIRHAVAGMLPANKLRDKWLSRLYIYADSVHPYGNKISQV